MNTGVHVSFSIMLSLGYMPSSGVAGSYNTVVKNPRICLPIQETRVQSLGLEEPLEKEMAIHFSILAWRIPWTEDPGRPQSMGSQELDTI